MKKLKILNCYCGIGGNRKLWGEDNEITAIEYDPEIAKVYQANFPNDTVIVTDAHEYLLKHFAEYNFIWCSPPCPSHSRARFAVAVSGNELQKPIYPKMTLYEEIIMLKHHCKALWLVENVIPYYDFLIKPTVQLHRHPFWCNFSIEHFECDNERKHQDIRGPGEVYGFNLKGSKVKDRRQVLRNMVDPDLGLHIFNAAKKEMGLKVQENQAQLTLF